MPSSGWRITRPAGYIIADVERLRKPMQAITDFLLSAIGLRPRGEVVILPRLTQEQAG